ncbi:MAG: succinate dehydrogenase/fumarate reductase iron-sulfur subunit [Acidobacteria bacterium]|nr:succinate dehydrogenase/fumarate reductase iron-sulfur subunit [Acidobacteriota bacterium]
MHATETWIFRILVLGFTAAFAAQVWTRARLILRARNNVHVRDEETGRRLLRFIVEVVFQSRTIAERPAVGLAHLGVYWGFTAFALYTGVEFLAGLGIADFTGTRWFHLYALALVPFSVAVILGISGLLVRRAIVRPAALGDHVSGESVLIGFFILTLMITFLLAFTWETGLAARVNWWVHAMVILGFLVLIPDSKHFHLVLSPLTVYLRSPGLATVPNLDFEQEQVGLETLADVERKQVLDAFTCVECGRCQVNCPAHGTGKQLNPKTLILQNEEALLAGRLDAKLADVFGAKVLWQCTTCGACEAQCPVGIEHLPLIIGARRGLASNGEAPAALAAVYNHLERRGNIWGLGADLRQKFVQSAGVEIFDAARHEYLVWLGCAGAFEADFQKSLRSLFDILRACGVTFGVLAKERCTGDVAKRTGNEYQFQELARANIEDFTAAGVKKIVTSCPHCLRTMGTDYREFGFTAEVIHAASLVGALTRTMAVPGAGYVTFHDPCYLGRYAGVTEEPRELLARFGAEVHEPERHGANPFCCGAGGGLLFEEHEEGRRISQERFEQLQRTGAPTIVTACPFCSIMLKGAQASANTQAAFVDLISFVDGRMKSAAPAGAQRP